MKAAYYTQYGAADVVKIKDIPRPELNGDEILVKVYATSVNTADWRIRASAFPLYAWLPGRLMFGLFAPKSKVLGADFAGRVVAKGSAVTRFKGGDAVFGFAGRGAHAEYLKISQAAAIEPMPSNLSYLEAAAVPFGALSSLVFLRDFAKVEPGKSVLIYGASGGLGVFAVQLAKHFGADVTGVCSTANMDLVKSLGADQVIDYSAEDFSQNAKTYDVIIDTVGKVSFRNCKASLAPGGVFVPIEFKMREIIQLLITKIIGGKKVVVGISQDRMEDLRYLADLLSRAEIRPVIDTVYPLGDIVPAHRRVESRHKTGSVVIAMPDHEIASSRISAAELI